MQYPNYNNKKRITRSVIALLLGLTSLPTSTMATAPSLASMLEQIRTTPAQNGPALNNLISNIDSLSTADAQVRSLISAAPIVDLSLRETAWVANAQMLELLFFKLKQIEHNATENNEDEHDPIKNGDYNNGSILGFNFGDSLHQLKNRGFWARLIGSKTVQKVRSNIPGYDGPTFGGALGYDFISPNSNGYTFGGLLGFQRSNFDSREYLNNQTKVNRAQATLYAQKEFCKHAYLNGALTYGYSWYDVTRRLIVPSTQELINQKFDADFNAYDAQAYFALGYNWRINHVNINPQLSVNYLHINPKSYTEDANAGLNLNIAYDDINSLLWGAKIDIAYCFHYPKVIIEPIFTMQASFDSINDAQKANASFTSGGLDFLTVGPTQSAFNYTLGLSSNVHSYKNLLLNFGYYFAGRSDYYRHNFLLNLKYNWA